MLSNKLIRTRDWASKHCCFLLAVLVSLTICVITANYPFLWDDELLIEHNQDIANIDNIHLAFTEHYLSTIQPANTTSPYYRPISLALLFVEKHLFGNSPSGYRIVMFTFHLISMCLLYFIILRLSDHHSLAPSRSTYHFAGLAILYITVLPSTTDALLFLTNIGDAMTATFMLSVITLFLNNKYKPFILTMAAVFAATLMAVFSKETGVITPLLLLAIVVSGINTATRRYIVAFLTSSAAAVFVYGVVRFAILPGGIDINLSKLVTAFPVHFIQTLVWAIAPYPPALMKWSATDIGIPMIVGATALLLLYNWLVFFYRKTKPMISMGLLFWELIAAPAIVSVQFTQFISSRYLYLPAVGFAICLPFLFSKSTPLIRRAMVGGMLIFLLLSAIRVNAWKSNESLWSCEFVYGENNPITLLNYGGSLPTNEANQSRALQLYFNALSQAKKFRQPAHQATAHCEIARILENNEATLNKAFWHYTMAAKIQPDHVSWLGIARIHGLHDHEYKKSLKAYQIALKYKPGDPVALRGIAVSLIALERYGQAIRYLHKIKHPSPEDIRLELKLKNQTGFKPKSTH